MFKKHRSGISAIEVIIVLAISVGLFGIVVGTLSSRNSLSRDNAARQVMSEIALVRNEAQQGYSPTSLGSGFELFGTAIRLQDNGKKITVIYLKQNIADGTVYESSPKDITMPESLEWMLDSSSACESFGAVVSSSPFYSCYKNDSLSSTPINLDINSVNNQNILLVFRNGTGESYVFSAPASGLGDASKTDQYLPIRQKTLRLAFWYPNSTSKYYADFLLGVPNDQTLRIVR